MDESAPVFDFHWFLHEFLCFGVGCLGFYHTCPGGVKPDFWARHIEAMLHCANVNSAPAAIVALGILRCGNR